MNVFKSHSVKKKLRSKDSLRSLHNKDSSTSLNSIAPTEVPLPEVSDMDSSRMKFCWSGGGEYLNYGIFCGQSAIWGNTVYFKNGGTSDIYEFNSR